MTRNVDECRKAGKKTLRKIKGTKLYADDIGDSIISIKDMFKNVEKATVEVGLKINKEKTKYMYLNSTTRQDSTST